MKQKIIIFVVVLYTILNLITILSINKLDMLPVYLLVIIITVMITINIMLGVKIFKEKISIYVLMFLFVIINVFLIYNINHTISFFSSLGMNNYDVYNFQIYSKENIEINNITIGILNNNTESNIGAISYIEENYNLNITKYDTNYELISALYNNEIEALIIDENQFDIILENDYELVKELKKIIEFTILVESDLGVENVDIKNSPFILYLTGIDIDGNISRTSLSDVNIIFAINPTTKEISMISVPRDYYVELPGISKQRDKLTHATLYGVDTSIKTMENLLEIDISHYIKVNFSTLVEVINIVGPLSVDSKYSFCSNIYCFDEGINELSGIQALWFSRERKSLPRGDIDRAYNQQLVINSLIEKAVSPELLLNYLNILKSLEKNFETTLTNDDISSLVKMQLSDLSSWNVNNYVVNGIPSLEYTYSYGTYPSSVLIEDEESLKEARDLINKTLKND